MKHVLDASVAICWEIPRPLTLKANLLRDEYPRQIPRWPVATKP
jgi:hypothetical protein